MEWYYSKDGEKQGPVTSKQLKELAASGQLQPTDSVWKEGMKEWAEAKAVKGLFAADKPADPLLPPPVPPPARPGCRQQVVVPEPADDADTYALAEETSSVSGAVLISCKACQKQIARTAPACPQCGAPNDWTHSEVQRFLASAQSFELPTQWFYFTSHEAVWGNAMAEPTEKGGAKVVSTGMTLFGVGLLLMFFGPIGWSIGGLLITVGLFLAVAGSLFMKSSDIEITQTEFRVDFSGPSPHWQSNDDEFWKDVKDFFRLNHVTSQRIKHSQRTRRRKTGRGGYRWIAAGVCVLFVLLITAFVAFCFYADAHDPDVIAQKRVRQELGVLSPAMSVPRPFWEGVSGKRRLLRVPVYEKPRLDLDSPFAEYLVLMNGLEVEYINDYSLRERNALKKKYGLLVYGETLKDLQKLDVNEDRAEVAHLDVTNDVMEQGELEAEEAGLNSKDSDVTPDTKSPEEKSELSQARACVQDYIDQMMQGDLTLKPGLVDLPSAILFDSVTSLEITSVSPTSTILGTSFAKAVEVEIKVRGWSDTEDRDVEHYITQIVQRDRNGQWRVGWLDEAARRSAREGEAATDLSIAKSMMESDPVGGKERLERIVRESGAAEAMAEAREMLEELQRQQDSEKREEKAASKLRLAKALRQSNPVASERRLKEILETYGGTKAAAEAQKLLNEVGN